MSESEQDYEQAHDVVSEFASDLGFRPGYWPSSFLYDGQRMQLLRIENGPEDDEVLWVDYGFDGGRLRVLND
jgi:hypothetical protein